MTPKADQSRPGFECEKTVEDHKFDGSENEIGLRPGEEGPSPPGASQAWSQSREKETRRLEALIRK